MMERSEGVRSRLDRLRLRLGLFRYKNYGRVQVVLTGMGSCWWSHLNQPPHSQSHRTRFLAIHYIRRCVRLGVRP